MVRICEVAIARGVTASRAKAHVTVVVDWETLMDDVLGRADGMITGPFHRREIERLLCDCHVSRVVMGPGSKPLDVGRKGQSCPAPIRRGIVIRDCGCQWPGCEIPAAWCDVHHFVHWIHGGHTSVANGVVLCSRHHRFLHAHPDWITTFEDQVLRVYRPDGSELHRHPWAEEHETDPQEALPGHVIRPEPILV